ncbi:hypothetical protein [Streptomyces massasporeus]|uniref:hypothetical protein n=1 Tax=Streptomyces massasporeus TaxID=67324 RepID=UPI00368B0653
MGTAVGGAFAARVDQEQSEAGVSVIVPHCEVQRVGDAVDHPGFADSTPSK